MTPAKARSLALLALAAAAAAAAGAVAAPAEAPRSKLVRPDGPGGRLVYAPYDERGDMIPDFSHCGYGGGGVPIPDDVPVKATLAPEPNGDDRARVQQAIDRVSALSRDPKTGFRGAVLLKRGTYRLSDTLRIAASGVVLRGEGSGGRPGAGGTVLLGTARRQYTLVTVRGASGREEAPGSRQEVMDAYVPVGARTFRVADATKFRPGDTVVVLRRGNAAWITEIGMDRITPRPNADPAGTKQWQPFDLPFDRVVTRVEGDRVTVDAPLVCAIDARWGGGAVFRYTDAGRIEKVGVEDLHGSCEFDPSVKRTDRGREYLADEAHAKTLVTFDNVRDAWARRLSARYLEGVSEAGGGAKWVTVQDCSSVEPVSVLTGSRRYPFSVNGQLCLVLRCYARDPRHAFVLGSRVCGPNAFVDCKAEDEHATSEPHHRWSVGGLFDNVSANIAIQDRQWMGSGHGWAGANYVAWNCEGSLVAQRPPTAQNFAIGHVGRKAKGAFERPDGWWESPGAHVAPRSLYRAQLRDRLGSKALGSVAGPDRSAEVL